MVRQILMKIVIKKHKIKDKETQNYLYDCLKKSERGKQWYIFKTTPLITHWSRSHNRIMRYSGALGY